MNRNPMTADPATPRPTEAAEMVSDEFVALVNEARANHVRWEHDAEVLEECLRPLCLGAKVLLWPDPDAPRAYVLPPIDPRVIAIGQAWVAAEGACGTAGVEGPYLGPRDQRDDFEAEAFAPNHAATRRVAPSPEAALLALAAALTDQERSHD